MEVIVFRTVNGKLVRTVEVRPDAPKSIRGGDDEIDQLKFEDRETLKPRRAPWEE